MNWLSDRAEGRDNNLNLIRFLAASAVLVSHAVPIALGDYEPEPLEKSYGVALGTLAVYVFFVVSGFLITASFQRSSSRSSFVLARILRLMPGLFVSLVLITYVMGPMVTSLSAWDYLTLTDTAVFFIKNLTMVKLEYYLPGVFTENPVSSVVGSIWTLRHEVFAYIVVFLIGISGGLATRTRATLAVGGCLGLQIVLEHSGLLMPPLLIQFLPLIVPFLLGALAYVWRDCIPLSLPLFGLLVMIFVVVGGANDGLRFWTMNLSLCYIVLWLAYVPGGAIRAFNRIGDYSYGIYVYAFPVQGLAVYLLGAQSMWENVLYSLPPTILLGVLSWHLVEKPCLATKPWLMTQLKSRSLRA